jgi:hypothetical protein
VVELITTKIADSMVSDLKRFQAIFEEQKNITFGNIAKSAVKEQRKALDEATTQWGYKRMKGVSGSSIFKPYGKSAGRNDTGQMMSDVGYEINTEFGTTSVDVGWIDGDPEGYYDKQENGFTPTTVFMGVRSGKPRFRKSRFPMEETQGAKSLTAVNEYLSKAIKNRGASGASAAWNEALRIYNGLGGKGTPGTYLQARKAYRESYKGNEIF